MPNPEHLKILEQGVDVWNEWRKNNPEIMPNLSEVKLSKENFYGTNFNIADLVKAELNVSDIIKANSNRSIPGNVNLSNINLTGSNLSGADLDDVNLSGANLNGASLSGAKLKGTNLRNSKLISANLINANLSRAIFNGVDLYKAKLIKANLSKSDLRYSTLVNTNLSEAKLTGAKLYGTSRDDWIIDGVICDYVYWDEKGEIRSPKGRDFAPGEFEQIYKSLPIIEYVFQNGMLPIDPLIMDRVVQAVQVDKPEFNLKIDSINARGLAPSIKFTVQQEEHKESALQEITKQYECRLAQLESDKDKLMELLAKAIDKPGYVKQIVAGPHSNIAVDGSTINITQHIHNALDLQKAIRNEPSKSFRKIAKKKALDVIGGALEDLAKDEVKSATSKIIDLGKKLGPWFIKKAAYVSFKVLLGQ